MHLKMCLYARNKEYTQNTSIYVLLVALYSAIPNADNTFKIITIYSCLHTEFSSMFYNDKGYAFGYMFWAKYQAVYEGN